MRIACFNRPPSVWSAQHAGGVGDRYLPAIPTPTTYWDCDAIVGGEVLDQIGTAHLTATGCSTSASLPGEPTGRVLTRNGGDVVTGPANTLIANLASDVLCGSLWVKFLNPATDVTTIFSKGDNNFTYVVERHTPGGSSGDLYFYGVAGDQFIASVSATAVFNLAFRWTGLGSLQTYLNGGLAATNPNVFWSDSALVQIGQQTSFGTDRDSSGRFDDIALWQNVDLAPAHFAGIYQRGRAGQPVA